jgi:hypothetical protein
MLTDEEIKLDDTDKNQAIELTAKQLESQGYALERGEAISLLGQIVSRFSSGGT